MPKKPTNQELTSRVKELEKELAELKQSLRSLRESEERFRSILTNIEEGYFEVDLSGNLIFFNDSVCRVLGYTRDELMGMNNRQFTTPESAKNMYRIFNEVYRTGKPAKVEDYEIIRKDGRPCVLAMSASLLRDSRNEPIGFRGIARDITDRKKAEEALRESEGKYRHLVNHAPAGIYEVDYLTRQFVTVNDVMCEYTGYTKDEFLSLNPLDILPEEGKAHFLNRLAKVFAGEKVPETVEYKIRGKNGREFWVILNTRFIYENGRPTGATVVVHDITERKEAEEALRKSEERYRLLVDHASDAIFIAQEGRILFPNPRTLDMFGYEDEELARLSFAELIHPEDKGTFLSAKRRAEPGPYSLRVMNKKAKELWVEVNEVPITWEGHAATLNFVRDVTPQKRLEAQLLQAQKMEAIGTIASGVAHNFRNILTVISMKSQLIQMKYRAYPALQETAEGINTYVQRGVQLVESLMQFCRKEPKREYRPLNLSDVIRETYQLFSKSFDKMIEIRVNVPEGLPIMGDSAGLSQVLMNLCTNARDAMPHGGCLTIEGRRSGSSAVVLISDTGHGMDTETMEKCFDPFFTTKDTGKGTGLGLSTAYGIVRDHRGGIQVASELGNGTTFTLIFPLTLPSGEEKEEPDASIIHGKGQKILVVDDEVDICRVMGELLESFGYEVAHATGGAGALKLYKSWKPDAVLLDRNMPEMDGLSCCEQMTALDPQAKVVIVSGYDEKGPLGIPEDKRKLIKGYLTKPINITELMALTARILEET